MRGAFVRYGKAPASGAGGAALSVATVRDGSCTGDRDDPGTFAERGLKRDLHVADDFRWSGNYFGGNFSEGRGDFFPASPGCSNAGSFNLLDLYLSGDASLANGSVQRFAGSGFADAGNVAGASGCGREKTDFVADGAGGLAAAAIDAQIISHGTFLSHTFGRR